MKNELILTFLTLTLCCGCMSLHVMSISSVLRVTRGRAQAEMWLQESHFWKLSSVCAYPSDRAV